jgi:hypothetical protein
MNRIRPIVIGAAAVCAVGLATPAAFASSGGSAAQVKLTPSSMHSGATVSIDVDCTAYNSPRPSGVSSKAFGDSVPLHPVPGQDGHFAAAATITSSVKPGSYVVSGSCMDNGETTAAYQSTLVIGDDGNGGGDQGNGGGDGAGDGRGDDTGQVTGPVRTGVGGSTRAGSPTQIAIGAGLVVSAGAVALWRRRRTNGEGTGGGS